MEEYTEHTKIGEGSFGEVFKATKKGTNELHALKKFKGESAKSISNEMGALINLPNHSGIVKLKGIIKSDDGCTYLQMEYCNAGNLDTFWKTHKPDLKIKYSFMKEISEAVAHLHENGVAHRDLKPANILIMHKDGEYHTKLGDFGVSKKLDSNVTSNQLMSTKMVGTPFFIAPEMFAPMGKKKVEYTPKVDVFSMGIIFRAMLFDRFIQPMGEPILGDCYYAEGTMEVSWGATLSRDPQKKYQIDPRKMKSFLARNILDSMLTPDPLVRPKAKEVARQMIALEPEDFYIERETGLQRTKSMPEGQGHDGVPIAARLGALHLSEGARASPGGYADMRELSQTMKHKLDSEAQKMSLRHLKMPFQHPSRATTPLRRSDAVQEAEEQDRWRTAPAPVNRPTLQRAATVPAPTNQLGLSSADLMETKQLIAMWESSLKPSANPLQQQELTTTARVLKKSIDKIERGQSLNEDEMRSFSSAWTSMDELMQLEEHDSLFD